MDNLPNTKFHYDEWVLIKEGFCKGFTGQIVSVLFLNSGSFHGNVYEVRLLGGTIVNVDESELEYYKEKE